MPFLPRLCFQADQPTLHIMQVALSDVMKSKGEVREGHGAEEAVMLRLYEYIHDKTSTLKQVFMEFDADGSGKIDEQAGAQPREPIQLGLGLVLGLGLAPSPSNPPQGDMG